MRPFLLLMLVLALFAPSCAEDRILSKAAPAEEPTAARGENDKTGVDGAKKTQGGATDMPRKIIRNGDVRLVVKAYRPVRKQIDQMVGKVGGYVSKSDVQHSLGKVSSATLVLRVPTGKFDGLLRTILKMGVVERESISTRDVTEKYYDLKARLDNAKKLERRLLELMQKQTSKLADLLKVEQELARVRERIEVFEGKLRLLNNLVDLSTLTIHLSIQEKYIPPRPPSLGDDISQTLGDSWDALKRFGRGLFLVLVALLPWLVPLAVILWLFVRWLRKRRARKAALATAVQASAGVRPPSPAAPSPGASTGDDGQQPPDEA